MIRRAIGLVLILIGLAGLVICYLGARAGRDFADSIALSADEVLGRADSSLNTVEESLTQSRQSISAMVDTIATVRETTANLASTVDDTQPMLDELALLVGQDIPNTIGHVQDTIPSVAQTAKVVDETLRLLSRLQVEETIPLINYDISFGLGVEYDPEIPFDQAVEEVGSDLAPLAETSASLEGELRTTMANMGLLSRDLTQLTVDLGRLNQEVSQFRPLLDEYSTQVSDMQAGIDVGGARLEAQLSVARRAIVLAAVWLGLSQLLPLYLGVELLKGNRMVRPDDLEAR
jgi:hypothetical protein